MEGVLDPQSYSFDAVSLPYMVMAGLFVVAVVYVLFSRGNPIIRGTFLAIAVPALVFAVAQSLAFSSTDPEVATSLFRFYSGLIAFIGPAVAKQTTGLNELFAQDTHSYLQHGDKPIRFNGCLSRDKLYHEM